MRFRLPFISCAMIIAVAACGKPDPVANNVSAADLPAPTKDAGASPSGGPSTVPDESEAEPASPAKADPSAPIPAALHGRWGLTPGDCTSALGDAKGLLVINGRELRFYESRAVPSPGIDADGDSITGNFSFTGEGQNWTKFEKLELRKNNLVRTESNPAASFIYAKC